MSRKNIAFDTGFLDKPLLHHHDTSVDDVVPPAETVQTSAEVLKSPFVLGGVLVVLSVFAIGLWQIMSPDVGVPAVAVHAPEVDVDFVSEVLVEKPVEVKASVPLVAEPVQETAMQDSAIEKIGYFPSIRSRRLLNNCLNFRRHPLFKLSRLSIICSLWFTIHTLRKPTKCHNFRYRLDSQSSHNDR